MDALAIPDAELEVLASLWQHGRQTVREIRLALEPHRPMTHGAVFTLLRRLEEKQLVTRGPEKVGKAWVYRPAVKPGETYRRKARELVERLFGGRTVTLVHSLFETRPPNEQEIDELQRLLDRLRRRRSEDETGQDRP